MSRLPFRHSEPWVYYISREINHHPKAHHYMFGIFYSSNNIILHLTDEKRTKITELSKDILFCNRVTVRKLAKLIGSLVARFPAITFG